MEPLFLSNYLNIPDTKIIFRYRNQNGNLFVQNAQKTASKISVNA